MRSLFFSPLDPTHPRAGWRIFVFIGVWFFLTMLILAPFGLIDKAIGGDGYLNHNHVAMVYVICLATLLSAKWAARYLDGRPIADYGLRFNRQWLLDYVFGFAAGIAQMLLIFDVLEATGSIRVSPHPLSWSLIAAVGAGLALHAGVGFEEELFSRGYQLVNFEEGFQWRRIPPVFATIGATLVTSIIFGFMHAGNPYATPISNFNLMLAGVSLAVPVLLTRQLGISMGNHTAWNFMQGPVLGFAVSGTPNYGTLLAIRPNGPQWLTGGAFGPEAGIVSIIAECAFVLATIVYVRSTRGSARIVPLSHRLPERASAQRDEHGGDGEQRSDRLPEIAEAGAANHDPARNLDEVRSGQQV